MRSSSPAGRRRHSNRSSHFAIYQLTEGNFAYLWAINEQRHAMITATHTEVKGQMGNRIQYAVTLSDGRTMTTTAKSEKDAIKTILKHVNGSAAPAMSAVQIMCEMIYRTTGVWSMEHTNLIARIHTVAHEQGNDMVDSIAHQLMKTHMISPAQASVLGRFAIANNINL